MLGLLNKQKKKDGVMVMDIEKIKNFIKIFRNMDGIMDFHMKL